MSDFKNIDELSVAAIRSMCIDLINEANSGHPGMSLSSAPIMYELYKDFMVTSPDHPNWINRDRFILSSGHASVLLYVMLHLCGYKITMKDLHQDRQLGSKCPGHPEIGVTPGVDGNTGPLGAGIAEAVGIAMAEQMLNKKYGSKVYDHYTYCLCGDGCLEEGISEEAIQYAGFQKLNKLILFYDKNNVTLDGPLAQSQNMCMKKRFEASGWNVVECKDGNNIKLVKKSIELAKKLAAKKGMPSVVIFETIIGFGSKNQGTSKVHGAPLGAEDGEFAKKSYGFDYPKFTIPKEVYEKFEKDFIERNRINYNAYVEGLSTVDPKIVEEVETLATNNVKSFLEKKHPAMTEKASESTRVASGRVLNIFQKQLPNLYGGTADVAGSVMTKIDGGVNFEAEHREGHNINWGVREFVMATASNGMLLHGGIRSYCGCFLIFSDYCKNAIRMAAMMNVPQIFLFSHDSIAVGEDGPSHEPIEQIAGLRATPNLNVFRPCDSKETYACWRLALESTKTPSALILSRQNLPLLESSSNYADVKKGAYIVKNSKKVNPDLTLIACGSEVSLALEVAALLKKDVRVVSMPCQELFDKQSEEYKEFVLGKNYEKRVSLEIQSTYGWGKYAKYNIGIDSFGASGKPADLIKHFKFTKEDIAEKIQNLLK